MTERLRPSPVGNEALLFGAAVVLTLACYWTGLNGGFLLDDAPNFEQLFRYVRGEIDAQGVIFTNASGPLGRPVSMASFLLTAWVAGADPWAFRFMNLGLHVANGALVVIVVSLIARSMNVDPNRNGWLSVLAGAFWLLIPLHVSTVLYPVQRMSQLSTLFVLIGVALFLVARAALIRNPTNRRTFVCLVLSMAAATAAAALAKENGALLPMLCASLHYCHSNSTRIRALDWFFAVVVAVPGMLLLIALAATDYLALAYQGRDFTLPERLLTQPRVLWDYVASLAVPDVSHMSLIRDDFPVSQGLLSPPGTLIAIVGWALTALVAVLVRTAAPMVTAGVFFFLAGHAMESTVFPLEMVFEHRNYLPSVGFVVAMVGAVSWLLASAETLSRRAVLLLTALPFSLIFTNAAATHARAVIWADYHLLLAHAYEQRPSSTRLAGLYFGWLIAKGSPEAALRLLERYEASRDSPHPAAASWRLIAACQKGGKDAADAHRSWSQSLPDQVDVITLQAAILLVDRIEAGACPDIGMGTFADDMTSWARSLRMPPTSHAAWRFELLAGRLHASAYRWNEALRLLDDAYVNSGQNVGIAVIQFQVAMSAGKHDVARRALERVRTRAPPWDHRLADALSAFEAALEAAQSGPSSQSAR